MAFRITTRGMYRAYRTDLQNANQKQQRAMERVSTHRSFITYAEDPASASRAFQMRRSLSRMNDQLDSIQYLVNKYELAYTAVDQIADGTVDTPGLDGMVTSLRALTDTASAGRAPMAQDLLSKSESIVSIMNSSYSGEFIFAGADGKNVPFSWDGDTLLYRGVDVSAQNPSRAYNSLQSMADEKTFVDVGLGMEEDEEGNILPDSAFNSSIYGMEILGWGQDEDGDSKNMAVLMRELGTIFSRCDSNGDYEFEEDEERAFVLTGKLEEAYAHFQEQHVRISADTNFIKNMQSQLEESSYSVNELLEDLEQEDPALAITEMSWALYCYQAALRIGQNILSESLFNYMS